MIAKLMLWKERILTNNVIGISITNNNPAARMLVIAALLLLACLHGMYQQNSGMLGMLVIIDIGMTAIIVRNSVKRTAMELTYATIAVSLIAAVVLIIGPTATRLIELSNYNFAEIVIRGTNVVVIIAGLMTYPWMAILVAVVDLLTSGHYDDEDEEKVPED